MVHKIHSNRTCTQLDILKNRYRQSDFNRKFSDSVHAVEVLTVCQADAGGDSENAAGETLLIEGSARYNVFSSKDRRRRERQRSRLIGCFDATLNHFRQTSVGSTVQIPSRTSSGRCCKKRFVGRYRQSTQRSVACTENFITTTLNRYCKNQEPRRFPKGSL